MKGEEEASLMGNKGWAPIRPVNLQMPRRDHLHIKTAPTVYYTWGAALIAYKNMYSIQIQHCLYAVQVVQHHQHRKTTPSV